MKLNKQTVTAVISAALLTGGAAFGQSGDAILDLLTKKGVISQKEANDAREQLDVQNAQTVDAYNKIKTSSWVNSLQFFGDGRLRYEYRGGSGTYNTPAGADNADLDRFRYRLRFGVKGDFTDNFSYGLRLETATKGNSANTTMGGAANSQGGANGSPLAGGPWGKGNTDTIAVGQLWATYKLTDWLTLTGGKIENPFMNTPMVWDGDLNPEGFAQKFTLKTEQADYFLTLGEFTYANGSKQNGFFGSAATQPDTWMFGVQGGGKVKFSKDMSFTLAPTFYFYKNATAGSTTTGVFNPNFTGAAPNNIVGVNDLNVFDMPAEFAFMIPGIKLPGKVFGDFAINTTADNRVNQFTTAAFKSEGNQDIAYQVGASIGSTKKKHDWMLKAYWQHTELNSLDPNLVDSDLFDSRLNMQGVVVNGQYLFTDFLSFGVTYANARAIDSNLPTLNGAGDLGGNLHSYSLLQADLVWKF